MFLLAMNIDATVQRAKAKDPKALSEIYTMYYPKMVGICMNIVRDDEDMVRDLVHDAFILAFASLDKLRNNERFVEWLTTIVRNVAIKHLALQQQKRRYLVPLSQIPPNDEALSDDSLTPDSDISHQEILKLIARLPEGYSKIFRLSVIEGFSHREIADMLDIEPHSSSSQLSRAKNMLKRMMDNKMWVVIIILIVFIPLCLIMWRHDDPSVCVLKPTKKKNTVRNTSPRLKGDKDTIAPHPQTGERHKTTKRHVGRMDDVHEIPDSVTVSSIQDLYEVMEEQRMIVESAEDSTQTWPTDSTFIPVVDSQLFLANQNKAKKNNWKFLAASSLGPSLAENVYKLIAIDNGGNIEPDSPSIIFPENVNTWKDYSWYLNNNMPHGNIPANILALMEIAAHNTGDIIEKEEHDKPVTLGISFNKTLNERWSIETGLQYSLLNSRFTMGDGGYAVVEKQKVHYLGVPLKLSYRMIDYKQLSAYSSAGLTFHIPVYGEVNTVYRVNGQAAYSENRHLTPPFQWQTSFSVGLQYKFTPTWSVFVEPTLNWFVPSGSDIHTIWTGHPVMFTSPFGIRITW